MLAVMSATPFAAICMLDEILCVTEACSSTAAAMAADISLMRRNGLGDSLDDAHGAAGGALHLGDLATDLLGRLGGL